MSSFPFILFVLSIQTERYRFERLSEIDDSATVFLRCEGYRGESGGYRGGGYIGGGYGGESDGYKSGGYGGGKREKWMKPH